MTTTPTTTPDPAGATTGTSDGDGDGGALLADALSANALFSTISGLALLVGSPWLADPFGVAAPLLAALGIGLLGFAVAILGALGRPDLVRSAGRLTVAADVAWVLGAVAVVRAALLAATGAAALLTVTVVVGVLAVAQVVGLRRARRATTLGTRAVEVVATGVTRAAPPTAWALVADAAGYAAHAPGIVATTTDGVLAEGMRRTCTDGTGDEWGETCTTLVPGRRYRMEVDTASYPLKYRAVLHAFGMTWEVEPHPRGARLVLTFSGSVKRGWLGRFALARLVADDPAGRIVARYVEVADEAAARTHTS